MIPPSQCEGRFQLGASGSKGEAIPFSTPPTRFRCSGSQAQLHRNETGAFPSRGMSLGRPKARSHADSSAPEPPRSTGEQLIHSPELSV